jgi:hypothetical protein
LPQLTALDRLIRLAPSDSLFLYGFGLGSWLYWPL